MSDIKPNVFPKVQLKTTNQETTNQETLIPKPEDIKQISSQPEYEEKLPELIDEFYNGGKTNTPLDDAIEQMRLRTLEQLRLRSEAKQKEQEKSKDEVQTEKPKEQIKEQPKVIVPTKQTITSPIKTNFNMNSQDSYIEQLSQPQYNMSFDVIPLPSEGKLYKNKKANVRVAYMTTADENILTSPNLLKSGEFLEILINRKLLEHDLRYRDLHVGDRNAIMLWIRATGYGEMYPVTLFDENNDPFETEVNLNTLKVNKLGAEPDAEGLFNFKLPVSKFNIKFRLLNVGDIDDIQKIVDDEEKNGIPINNTSTYALERQLVEVDGERNKTLIKEFVQNMRVGDAKALRDYISNIESGVDLNIEVGTPGGGSIKTFLPLNFKFFWPNISI